MRRLISSAAATSSAIPLDLADRHQAAAASRNAVPSAAATPIALAEGMTQAQLDALPAWEGSGLFDATDRAVLAYCDAMTTRVHVPGHVATAVRDMFPPRQLVELTATIAGLDPTQAKTIQLYCDDMQVDSDEPQIVEILDPGKGVVRLTLVRPEFAPKSPTALSGVLHCPAGWPGIGSTYLEFSAPWPEGSYPE